MIIAEYFHSGIIEDLYNRGIVSWHVYNKFSIYRTYQNYLIKEGHAQAIKDAAIDHNVSNLTVRRAIKLVES